MAVKWNVSTGRQGPTDRGRALSKSGPSGFTVVIACLLIVLLWGAVLSFLGASLGEVELVCITLIALFVMGAFVTMWIRGRRRPSA